MSSKPKAKFKHQPFKIEKLYHYQRFLKKRERGEKENERVNKKVLHARTQISLMLYSTFIFLAIKGRISEEAVIAVVATLMGHWFGEHKNSKSGNEPKS